MESIEIAKAILAHFEEQEPVRLILAGPCGVGKTTAGKAISLLRKDIKIVEQDLLKSGFSPCSISKFDFFSCFSPQIENVEQFLIDIGGGLVFRPGSDNDTRLENVLKFKKHFSVKTLVLTSSRKRVRDQYLKFPGSIEKYFDNDWENWINTESHFWNKCVDFPTLKV